MRYDKILRIAGLLDVTMALSLLEPSKISPSILVDYPYPNVRFEPSRIDKIVGELPYQRIFEESISQQRNVSFHLAYAVMMAESNGNPRAISEEGAMGLMQLMPETAKMLGVKDPYDPKQSSRGGVKYLSYLMNHYSDERAAVAAYNLGEFRVNRLIKKHGEEWWEKGRIPRETREYVKKVFAFKEEYKKVSL